jgi:hypothetical protein
MTTNDAVYMINTGPEAPYDGTNYGTTNEFTSQVGNLSALCGTPGCLGTLSLSQT